ncbi:MAG: TonB-dependent receptor [Acidobacteria bacterium]|nr:TonB-dependent receptor [Acidobacteriota bacterium]
MKTCVRMTGVVCLALTVIVPRPVKAQTPAATGRLLVTVVDQTGAVLPTATVTVVGQETATRASSVAPVTATEAGLATFGTLALGRYTVQAEFPGFETATVRDVRVREGDNRRTVTLRLKKLEDSVTVGRDGRSSGLDPRGNAFSTVLTREMIEALPDDPEEMEAVLKAMSPPGAQLRIDGFSGGQMPAKSQIRSIRLPRMDQFAAQNHGGMQGAMFIDIMTQPGAGPLRGSVDTSFNDDALNARNPFQPVKGDEQLRQYGMSLSGTIRPNKTSFAFNAGATTQYSSPNLLAVLADGSTVTDTLRTPTDMMNATLRLDHAINNEHALRLSVTRTDRDTRNQGIGGFNLLDRAYRSESSSTTVRLSENGPLGRRMFSESRLQLAWGSSSNLSNIEAPTIRVNDAFTSGGAQQRGGQSRFDLEAATDLDYVKGAHSWRTGVMLEAGRYRSDDIANYLGTYTFASLDDFRAGRPMSYTRRIGDPNLTYSRWQAGAYVQDDWRASRSVMVSAGLRAGFQSLTGDQLNVSPRLNLAWSPFSSGKTTFRTGYGYFYDWLSGDLYKQTLQVDGFRQRELNVLNPSYPAVPEAGVTSVTNQYLWSDDLALPSGHRMHVGADRTITPNQRVNINYSRAWGRGQLRGRNLNTPVDGVRPNPAFANILSLVSDAESTTDSINVGWNLTKLDWKQSFFFVNYTWTRARTNTTGAFSVPANGENLDTEWGPSMGDIRHRASASVNMRPFTDMSISLNARAQSGSPYNITTGRDDNRDGLFNDRPAGVDRNSARTAAQWDLGGRISYAWGFGTPAQAGGGSGGGTQVVMIGGGGGMAPGFGGGASSKRFRIEVYLSGQNLLNRANYVGYSGVVTSPFFGQPTSVMNPRKVQAGVRFGF